MLRAILAVVLLSISATAGAVEPRLKTSQAELILTPLALMPLGDWGDAANIGIGATLGLHYRLLQNVDATARAGYIYHFTKTTNGVDSDYRQLPVLVGARFWLDPRIFTSLEVGPVMHWAKSKGPLLSADETEWELGGAVGAGVSLGAVGIVAQLWSPNVSSKDRGYGILAGVEIPLAKF